MWLKEGERLARLLKSKNVGKTEFARSIGREFHTVHRWTKGYEFGPENQGIAALQLNVPPDHFAAPSAAEKRDRATREALEQFTKQWPPMAAALSDADWQVMRSVRFPDPRVQASAEFFRGLAFALLGALRFDELEQSIAENVELSNSLARKPPLPKKT